MKGYIEYMDRQTVSPRLHTRLLALEQETSPRKSGMRWTRIAALAACMCLVVTAGLWGYSRMQASLLPMNESVSMDAAAAAAEESGEMKTEESAPAEQSPAMTEQAADAAEDADTEMESAAEEAAEVEEPDLRITAESTDEEGRVTVCWTDKNGRFYELCKGTGACPEETLPVIERSTADWTEVKAALIPTDGVIGFVLTEGENWMICRTDGDVDVLWQLAMEEMEA